MAAAKLTPILEIAREILKTAGLKGMHIDDVAARAIETHQNLGLPAEAFSRKLQGALAANLKLKTQTPSFVRVERKKGQYKKGWYRAKVDKSGSVVAQVTPPDTSDKAFIGKGGEYAVMGELLFWGYNISAMAVDNGVDLIANRSGRYFHIQVKTSMEQEGGRFQFTIKNSAFMSHHGSAMYYVFVLRRGLSNEFVIIPSTHLQILVSSGKISPGSVLSLTITVDASRKRYLLNGSNSVDIFVGNFGGIIV